MSESKKPRAEVQIEPVRPEELQGLADLATRSFRDAFGSSMDPADLEKSLAENRSVSYFEQAIETSHILVAKHEDKIVGYVQFGTVKIPEVQANEDDRELGRLYIDTDLQGQGIGRQLMDAALAEPSMAKAPSIYLQVWEENENAIRLYESYDFEKTGDVTHFMLADKPAVDLIMVRHQNQ